MGMTREGSVAQKSKPKEARHHATSDRVFDDDEVEFLQAIEAYKKRSGKKFPTYTDVLRVAKSLGYARVTEPTQEEPNEDSFDPRDSL